MEQKRKRERSPERSREKYRKDYKDKEYRTKNRRSYSPKKEQRDAYRKDDLRDNRNKKYNNSQISTSFTPLYFKGSGHDPTEIIQENKLRNQSEPSNSFLRPKPSIKRDIFNEGFEVDAIEDENIKPGRYGTREKRDFDNDFSKLEWDNLEKSNDRDWYDREENDQVTEESHAFNNVMGGSIAEEDALKKKLALLKPISKKTVNQLDNSKWEVHQMLHAGAIKVKRDPNDLGRTG